MMSLRAVLCLTFILFVIGCGDDEVDQKACLTCGAGLVCDPATGTCVTAGGKCTSSKCGAHASCGSGNTCACDQGWYDCNKDLQTQGGNGCESSKSCSSSGCSPTTKNACSDANHYCKAGTCTACPGGTYNCDGINDCESSKSCSSSGCSPTTKNACTDMNHYCKAGTCTKCATGKYNCDGIKECESSTPCGISTKCDKTCMDATEYHCIKNPAKKNRCEACLMDAHCKNNPRSDGPFCDTSDLAGTGFSFCICKSNADCASSTVGKICKAASGTSNPKLKGCTCSTDKDCPVTHAICEGTMFKRCQKRCTSNADCKRGSIQGTCDTKTGKCSFSSFP